MTNQPLSREIKTAAVATSAQSTVVSRDHPTAGNSTSSYSSNTKTKAKAVVTPFARSQGGGKKVNINTVVSQFYIKSQTEEPDEPQVLYLFGGYFYSTQWLNTCLIHLFLMLKLFAPWKDQKTLQFSDVFKRYRNAILGSNELDFTAMFIKAGEVSCCWLLTVNYPQHAKYIDYKW